MAVSLNSYQSNGVDQFYVCRQNCSGHNGCDVPISSIGRRKNLVVRHVFTWIFHSQTVVVSRLCRLIDRDYCFGRVAVASCFLDSCATCGHGRRQRGFKSPGIHARRRNRRRSDARRRNQW